MTQNNWIFMDVGDTFVYGYPTLYKAIQDCWNGSHAPSIKVIEQAVRNFSKQSTKADFTSQQGFKDYFQDMYCKVLQELEFPKDAKQQSLALWQIWEKGHHLRLFDDALVTLKKLQENGYNLGIISNWDNSLSNVLERLGVKDLFSLIVHSTNVGYMKPDVRLFETAFEQVNVDHNHCWYLGDQIKVDIEPARQLGMKTVLIDYYGKHNKTDVATYYATSISLAAHLIMNHVE